MVAVFLDFGRICRRRDKRKEEEREGNIVEGEFLGENVASGGRLESWEAIIVRTTCPIVERISYEGERREARKEDRYECRLLVRLKV